MSIDCEKFDSFDAEIRSNALKAFAAEYAGKDVKEIPDNNMHCHTFYSYNGYGYSPAHVVAIAKEKGFYATGKVDFDVLDGVEEFLLAGKVLNVRTCAGVESRVVINEMIDEVINSPGEPGIAYHLGVGFTTEKLPAKAAEFLAKMKQAASDRTFGIVQKVNPALAPASLDFEKDVLPLTPAGNATERHVCAAYAAKAEELFPCEEKRAAFWAEKLSLDPAKAAALVKDTVKLQGEIRSKMMKKGGPGYVTPDPGSFPRIEDMNEFTRSCGAIPSIAWLNGESDGEKDPERLLDLHESKGAAAFNLIPDRNWNFADPAVKEAKVSKMHAILDACIKRDLPVFAGTELNAFGQKIVDDFSEPALAKYMTEFRNGAALLSAHTILAPKGAGYLSAWAEKNFASRKEKNAFFVKFGNAVRPAAGADLRGDLSGMTPAEILALAGA
ncbi:MAG: hypothetical protein IKA79_00145 [Lentisphaeria bacterium]|nr:hypothetical protein [Lentisphaeria bacterium]